MKRFRLWMALGLLILPLAARGLWFYRGGYRRESPVPTPDYAGLTMPAPPLTTALAEKASATSTERTVLVDLAHGNLFSPTELEALSRALTGLGAHLEIAQWDSPSVTDTLKYASAYVVLAPSLAFTPDEAGRVHRFVERGGRVLVIADPTRVLFGENVSIANNLLAPFDLTFSDDYIYNLMENEGNYRNVVFKQFADDPITQGLTTVVFYGACSVGTSTGTPLIQGDERALSSRTDSGGGLAVAALSANKQVLALGDLSFLTPPYYQVADNARLIRHVAEFLVGGERARDLVDMPFLFSRPVAVVSTKNITLTAEMAEPLGKLQATLKAVNIPVSVMEKPGRDSDLVVLGSYTPGDDLVPYLMPFVTSLSVTIPVTGSRGLGGAFIPVPGLGQVARSGTGVMLFSRTDQRTVLILLADNSDALSRLVGLLASGDLAACTIQEQIALCSVGKSKPGTAP